MTQYYRSAVPLFFILVGLFFSACYNNPDSGKTAGVAPPGTPARPLPDVSAIIKRMTTHDGCRDFTAEMLMTSVDEEGNRSQIEFRVQRKYSADGSSSFLTVVAPPEDRDKAFLAIERVNQPTQAFSYLAGLKKLTKLNSNRQLSIHGVKVTVQELLGMELGQYEHSAGVREHQGEETVIKVEFKEKPDLGLAFPRIVGYFREKDQQPAAFELYDSRNELLKMVSIEGVKQIQNRQTISDVAIDDLQQKLKLKLETRKIEYDRGLPGNIFTENHLKTLISAASRKLDQSRKSE